MSNHSQKSHSDADRDGALPHNKAPQHGTASQRNEARRTPESRNDRENNIGGGNQSKSRQGGPAGGH